MSTRDRVAHTARLLLTVAVVQSLLLGLATMLLAVAVARAAGAAAWWLALLPGLLVSGLAYRRVRGPGFTIPAVSLWIEEHVPALNYALVTAVEGAGSADLERSLAGVAWSGELRAAARQALGWPLMAVLASAALATVAPTLARVLPGAADRIAGGGRATAGALEVTVRVAPPAYARRPPATLRSPPVVSALVGSELRFSTGGDSLAIAMGDSILGTGREPSWRVAPGASAVIVREGSRSRLIAVDGIPDSAPAVVLREPARDSVFGTAAGLVALGADLRDDFGLRLGRFEYVVSSGSGETFTFTTGTTGLADFAGAASGAIAGRLDVAALGLKAGDFLHVRAVGFDLRGDTLSARGVSETRTIRVARAGEFDSVAVDAAAPPEADKAILSQRMLINLAEALVRRRSRLDRESFAAESRRIAADQARLRKQVGDIVFARLGDDPSGEHFHGDGHAHEGQELRPALTPEELLKAAENASTAAAGQVLDFEGDETPVVAVNRPLLEAYNFMWEAGRELGQASPERALPAMYRALAAIQRARAAERLYLRARPPRAVVDVARARLQGKEAGLPDARTPRAMPRELVQASGAAGRLARIIELARSDRLAAADSLLMLRLEIVGIASVEAAEAAAAAADDLRRGGEGAAPLAALRRALMPVARSADSLTRWTGVR